MGGSGKRVDGRGGGGPCARQYFKLFKPEIKGEKIIKNRTAYGLWRRRALGLTALGQRRLCADAAAREDEGQCRARSRGHMRACWNLLSAYLVPRRAVPRRAPPEGLLRRSLKFLNCGSQWGSPRGRVYP